MKFTVKEVHRIRETAKDFLFNPVDHHGICVQMAEWCITYASLLEAQGKAVPVMWCDPATINAAHPTCYKRLEYASIADSVAGVKFISLYLHSAPADTGRFNSLLTGTTSSGVHYGLHGSKESVEAVSNMIVNAERSAEALRVILEIGKRNLENSKYDVYFNEAREALAACSVSTQSPGEDVLESVDTDYADSFERDTQAKPEGPNG